MERNYPSWSFLPIIFFNLSIVSLIEPTILPSLKMIVFNRLKCNDICIRILFEYCLKHHKFLDLSLTIHSDSILEEISTFCFVFFFSQESNKNCSRILSKKRFFFLSFFHDQLKIEVKSIDKIYFTYIRIVESFY